MKYNNKPITSKKSKHYKNGELEFDYVPKKDFKNVYNENTLILGSVKLKETNKTKCDILSIESNDRIYNYEIINQRKNTIDNDKRNKKDYNILGYVLIADNTYVEILKPKNIFIPIIIGIIAIGGFFGCLLIPSGSFNEAKGDKPGLEIEEGNDWDGNMPENGEKNDTKAVQESITIPGYADLYVSEESPNIQLINPSDNSVYLIYTIKEGDNVIYETKAIENGKMVNVNMFKLLSKGKHELSFIITTYDIKTQAPCNGATQTVSLTVK